MSEDNFYYTYNARHLKPSEVAESFIWSESFDKLIQNGHTVILGARGCGKTTLMKMLTLPALYSWSDIRAEDIVNNIPFYAIYVSTDIYWDVKNQTYSSQLESFGNFSEIISSFAVTSNVFTSLCDTFINLLHYEIVDNSEDKEQELCTLMIKAWKLSGTIPRLKFIKEALNERIDEVNQLIQNLILNNEGKDSFFKEYFNLSFESSLEYIIPVFERIFCIQNKKKWALCFDELEFAPLWLQEKLFISLRSRKQYILYKLSASPILSSDLEESQKKAYGPTAGNDVTIIKMWSNSDNEQFSRRIIDSLLKKKYNNNDSVTFFGRNKIYNKEQDSYKTDSVFYKEMLELYKKDDGFVDFLKSRSVDINNIEFDSKEQRDILFRKIKPIVFYRNFYIDSNNRNNGLRLRSRKTNDLFSGIEVLVKICDGNPRWLISIVSAVLSKSGPNGANSTVQCDEIVNAANRFRNVISNIPTGSNTSVSIAEIINKLGAFFSNQVLGSTFYMDPKTTIEVNISKSEVSDHVVDMIKKGVSQGAFILLDSKDDSFDYELRGKKIKVSFLFFPLFKLPLRNYPSVKLSDCFKTDGDIESGQLFLFN